MLRALTLLILLAVPARAELTVPGTAEGPLAREFGRQARRGYVPAAQATASVGRGVSLVAVVFEKQRFGVKGKIGVYRVTRNGAKLIHTAPAFSREYSLASIHDGGDIPDLFGDGSRLIAYRVKRTNLEHDSLVVLRYAKGKISKLAALPFGRFQDLDEDGRPEIVSAERPLGRWFQLECDSFYTMAKTAFRMRVHSLRNGKVVLDSKSFPELFEKSIQSHEAELARSNSREVEDFGPRLGSALSLYFDHAELGRGRRGWERFREFFAPKWSDPRGVKRCLKEIESVLRERLEIPDGW